VEKFNKKDFNYNVSIFIKDYPFFYNNQKIFWFWDKDMFMWKIVDEIDILNKLKNFYLQEDILENNSQISNYITAMKMQGRENIPKDAPKKWIQFKDKAFSLKSGKIYNIESNYFFTNPIPHKMGKSSKTPVMDKLFKEWVGENFVKTLYELIAYCCYQDYPIQTLFCLFGGGRNGKGCFLKLIAKFIGSDNICSTDLGALVGFGRSRFETFKLYKKLVCMMGETDFSKLESSSVIKKLTGGDLINFEMKGKTPFDDYNYAKMIIASNSLPKSDDTSDGWYRRWLIIDFPNDFPEGKDILETIPEYEYENLARKVTGIIPNLIKNGNFTNQGNFEQRKERYISCSNPIREFLDIYTEDNVEEFIEFNILFKKYNTYRRKKKQRILMRKEFYLVLEEEGLFSRRTFIGNGNLSIVDGITLKDIPKQKTLNS